MIDVGFTFRGSHSKMMGVELQDPIKISAPMPRVETISIPGRNGDALFYDGSYQNRTITAKCYVLDYTLSERMRSVQQWLLGAEGYQPLMMDEYPGHYFMARVQNGAEIMQRAGLMNSFTVKFDAKPQMFRNNGETPIEFSSLVSNSSVIIENPTLYNASPLIFMNGASAYGVGQLWIGDNVISFGLSDDIIYDAELDAAYNESGSNLNYAIQAPRPIILKPGENVIKLMSGKITTLQIVPRWWDL